MVQRSRNIGRWLLVASSLMWAGCDQLSPRRGHYDGTSRVALAPAMAPPLKIAAPVVAAAPVPDHPAPMPDIPGLIDAPTLLPPQRFAPTQNTPEPPPPAPANPPTVLRSLHRLATERFAATPGYIARLRRREVVDGKLQPEEQILIKFRQDPLSIHMRWIGPEFQNREVLLNSRVGPDVLHVIPGVNDAKAFAAAGRHAVVRADNANALFRQRYGIAEMSIGAFIERLGKVIDAAEKSDGSVTLRHLGLVKRPEFDHQVDAVMQVIPAGLDTRLPTGGQRFWYFDPTVRFPALVITHDSQGQEVEYYCFDRFLFPARMQDEDFNPASLGRR